MKRCVLPLAVIAGTVLTACSGAPAASAPAVTVTAPASAVTATATATVTAIAAPTDTPMPLGASSSSQAVEPSASSSSATTSATAKLGGSPFTYPSGLMVKVSAAAPYTPSRESANMGTFKMAMVFDITVTNGTKSNFNPGIIQTSVQSGDTAGSDIIDVGNGVGMPPQTQLLPGRSVTYKVAFGVKDAKNLVLQVTPDYQSGPALFTS